ncbi:hypothetical protein FJ948_24740 [Mesorhizobium sp. B2-3-12]|nr:hypothetical protein FJ948_24740 [Mesorhizobium sp. B2-3-12]
MQDERHAFPTVRHQGGVLHRPHASPENRHAGVAHASTLLPGDGRELRPRRSRLQPRAGDERAYRHAFRCADTFHPRRCDDCRNSHRALLRPHGKGRCARLRAAPSRGPAAHPRLRGRAWSYPRRRRRLLPFGWDRFWDADPASFLADWPGLSRAACDLLIERGARIVGSDCLSVDSFGTDEFPAHNAMLSAGILIGENFARLGELPPRSFLITLPLPIEGGTGSPMRAVALVEAR